MRMVRLSACIEMLFTHLPFVDRVDAAAAAGAEAVEFWGAEGKDVAAVCRRARALGLQVATFACGAPLTDPSRAEEAQARLRQAIATAQAHGIPNVIVTTGNRLPDRARAEQEAAVVAVLRAVAGAAEAAGVRLNVELLNTLVDHRGYFLDDTVTAVRIVEAVGSPAVKVLYDIYHMQIMEGNLIATIRQHIDQIGYFHAADVPGRFEPGSGEIHYRNVVAAIEEAGYDGYIGLEFRPRGGAERSGEALRAAIAALRG
jgi:hydroxypyruvate isomerase